MTESRPTAGRRRAAAAAGERWGLATRAGTVITVAALTGLTALVLVGELDGRPSTLPLALDVALGAACLALVPGLRGRRSGPVAVALAVAAGVSPLATPTATFAVLHTARTGRARPALALAVVGATAHVLRGAWRPVPGLPLGWWVALVVVTHAALLGWGALARARADVVAAYAERARRAEQDRDRAVREARTLERLRIAREMHDSLAHRLSLVATYAGALEARPDATPEERTTAAGVVRAGVSRALDELREVVGVLRSEGPDDGGGQHTGGASDLAALETLVGEVRAAGQEVDVVRTGSVATPADGPAPLVSRTAYRVVQEGLTNARRHAPGQRVVVRLAGGPRSGLTVEVTNHLPGPVLRGGAPGHAGLVGLAERVGAVGGRLEHGTVGGRLEHGTAVAGAAEGAHAARPTPVFRLHAWLPWQP
ncbi:sensor histidine kinase [Actinotalea solisilvae]|uniref:sensor histidine kinase n=1 Tax=Actinotalea solisilvae TaxID=2072922 RepID=UPI0027DBA8B3|nr:histidine kinase [Actinotalea solisilvae]